MLTLLRLWTGIIAIVLAAVETYLNLTVYEGKPLPILLPYYVIAAWLFAGALFPRLGPLLLVSAWGVTLGHTYVVFVENLLIHHSSEMLVRALRNTTVAALLCLALANYLTRAVHGGSDGRTPLMKVLAGLLAALVITAQLSTPLGEDKPAALLVPYFLIAGLLGPLAMPIRLGPAAVLSVWSIAFGFFYAEFSGALVIFHRLWPIVLLGAIAVAASCSGVVLQSFYLSRGTQTAQSRTC